MRQTKQDSVIAFAIGSSKMTEFMVAFILLITVLIFAVIFLSIRLSRWIEKKKGE